MPFIDAYADPRRSSCDDVFQYPTEVIYDDPLRVPRPAIVPPPPPFFAEDKKDRFCWKAMLLAAVCVFLNATSVLFYLRTGFSYITAVFSGITTAQTIAVFLAFPSFMSCRPWGSRPFIRILICAVVTIIGAVCWIIIAVLCVVRFRNRGEDSVFMTETEGTSKDAFSRHGITVIAFISSSENANIYIPDLDMITAVFAGVNALLQLLVAIIALDTLEEVWCPSRIPRTIDSDVFVTDMVPAPRRNRCPGHNVRRPLSMMPLGMQFETAYPPLLPQQGSPASSEQIYRNASTLRAASHARCSSFFNERAV